MQPFNHTRTRIISLSAYSALFALGMTLTTWHELSLAQGRAPLEIIVAIIFNAHVVSVASAGFAAIVESGGYIVVLASIIIQKEQEKAHAKGLEEGEDKAYKDADEQIVAYYQRMRAALDAGEPFNEPPPRFRRNGR